MRATWLFIACLVLASCGSPVSANDEPEIRLARDGDTVVLSTESEEPLYYMAVDAALLPSMSWAACRNPTACQMVRRGTSARIPRSQLSYQGRVVKNVSVTWWQLQPTFGSPLFRAIRFRSTGIAFQ